MPTPGPNLTRAEVVRSRVRKRKFVEKEAPRACVTRAHEGAPWAIVQKRDRWRRAAPAVDKVHLARWDRRWSLSGKKCVTSMKERAVSVETLLAAEQKLSFDASARSCEKDGVARQSPTARPMMANERRSGQRSAKFLMESRGSRPTARPMANEGRREVKKPNESSGLPG